MFTNGRLIKGTEDAYDLEECALHTHLLDAVKDLSIRVRELPEIAPYLQTLSCEVSDEMDVTDYKPVCAGLVMKEMMSALKGQ